MLDTILDYLPTILLTVLGGGFVLVVLLNLIPPSKRLRYRVETDYAADEPEFLHTMAGVLSPEYLPGNRVETLVDGEQIFSSMLNAIRRAERTITFEEYVWWSGEVADSFATAFAERAREGVKVHVLLDWAGSMLLAGRDVRRLRNAGVEFRRYHPPQRLLSLRFNHRTHRRILVVDGKVGFTGGVAIADEWAGSAECGGKTRDVHYRVEGPVVSQIQSTFVDHWVTQTGQVLHGDDYFPKLETRGNLRAQFFRSVPATSVSTVRLMYLLSIASARRTIRLANAYFVPDKSMRNALKEAAARGVRVQIIVPGPKMDYQTVRRASRVIWGELVAAGIEIYEFLPAMYHSKLLIVDDSWVSVGSTNFDYRSFYLNDEANLNIADAGFAREQIECFEHDLTSCRPIKIDDLKKRSLADRVLDRAAWCVRWEL